MNMRARPGFRARAALTIAAFSLFLLVVQSVAIVILTYDQEDDLVNELLENQLRRFEEQMRLGQTPELPASEQFRGYLARTPAERSQVPAHIRDQPPGTVEIERDGRVLHIAVRHLGEATLYLVYDATPHEKRVREFSNLMVLAVLVMAVVAALAGYWVAGLLVRQVTDLAGRVARLRADDDVAVETVDYRDEEVASLARAITDYHRRTAELIRREKEFTANVSHELRTPLTAIRTSCELLAADPALDEKARSRIAIIGAAAERMTEHIQALLFLARETALGESETTSVREIVEETLVSLKEALRGRPEVQLEIDIDESATVETSRAALQLVLTNLLKNAIAYTSRGRIRVAYGARVLEVADTGSGIAERDLPRIFERFYRGANAAGGEHAGLGLAIVRSIAERLDWRIDVESEPGKGSCFRITFPASARAMSSPGPGRG